MAISENVAVRFIAANTHPDHDTICTFRREHKALLEERFVKVLELAAELKLLQAGQITVRLDGTKVAANASKHGAVSCARAGEQLAQVAWEVKQLVAKAEAADRPPLADGLSGPEEIARRQERQVKLAEARRGIEPRATERAQAPKAEVEPRPARGEGGGKVRGPEPQAPREQPAGKDHFEQAYNAPAAGAVDRRLIGGGARGTDAPNDKRELLPTGQAGKTEGGGARWRWFWRTVGFTVKRR